MPPKPSAKRPHSSPHIREDAITTPIHAQSESHTRFRPIEHVREQGPSTEARFRRQPHQKYTGFHPKAAKPNNKRTPSEDKLATALSEQLQANIQDAANEFSAQIVHSANELANNAADAVGADIQSAAGAISDAIANTSANIEANIKDTVARLGTDFEGQVAQYLTPKNIERAAVRIVHHLAHVAIGAQHLIMSSEHPNDQDERDDEEDPLLPARKNMRASRNFVNVEHWNDRNLKTHAIHTTRDKVKHFLSSKVGHYSVLTLVALDVAGIVAAFIISLFKCEKRWGNKGWNEALEALDIASLVFSSLFMLELLLAIWAFGPSYFKSKFHIIDALVVITGFALDLSLHGGAIEEAASLIVVLRLWRVFKIIEELSLGAQERVEEMEVEIEKLTGENLALKRAGLASKREGEVWRKELEKLREERGGLEGEVESEEQQIQGLEESPAESSRGSPKERPRESKDSKKKSKEADERYKDVWTEAPEGEVEEDETEAKEWETEEGETEYIEDYEAEIEDELVGGDYGGRAVGDEYEDEDSKGQGEMEGREVQEEGDSKIQGETVEGNSKGKEGILSKAYRVLTQSQGGDEAGEGDAGGEDALALGKEEDEDDEGEAGEEDDDNEGEAGEGKDRGRDERKK